MFLSAPMLTYCCQLDSNQLYLLTSSTHTQIQSYVTQFMNIHESSTAKDGHDGSPQCELNSCAASRILPITTDPLWLNTLRPWQNIPYYVDNIFRCIKMITFETNFIIKYFPQSDWIGLDWICLTTTHVLQDILAVLTQSYWSALVAIRHQAIAWTNVDKDLWWHMASPGLNKLMWSINFLYVSYLFCVVTWDTNQPDTNCIFYHISFHNWNLKLSNWLLYLQWTLEVSSTLIRY